MFWVCVLRVGINIISTQNKKLSMRHFTIMVNPNKSSLSNQIPKIKVAEFSPATTFRPPSVCEVNNSNANFSPKKVPTYSQLGKYYYGGNRVCVSFLSSVRRVVNPDCDDAKGLAALKTSDIARKLRCTRRETETVDVEGSNDGWGWKQTAQQTRRERAAPGKRQVV